LCCWEKQPLSELLGLQEKEIAGFVPWWWDTVSILACQQPFLVCLAAQINLQEHMKVSQKLSLSWEIVCRLPVSSWNCHILLNSCVPPGTMQTYEL
jgi:hypothetical protein